MADFASCSSTHLSLTDTAAISAALSSAALDDGYEDSCSICLEPFGTDDPATITSCKHEYHLHCILEWSQRSKECPICWQLLVLKDPASQELLAAVEAEWHLRSRNVRSSGFSNSRSPLEQLDDDSCSDGDSDFDEQIMLHLVAATSRARYFRTTDRQRSPGAGPSEFLLSNSYAHVSRVQPTLTIAPAGGSSPTSSVPSAADIQPPPSAVSPVVDVVAQNTTSENDVAFEPRVLYSQPPPESVRGEDTSEMFSIPESIKSKFSAASARYKESFSRGTRGLKEKLLARNVTVKELSKGVQREMNASIAGVARMIERLDLTSKRASVSPPILSSSSPLKGKTVQENDIGQSAGENSGQLICDVHPVAPAHVSSMVASRVEAPSTCVGVSSSI